MRVIYNPISDRIALLLKFEHWGYTADTSSGAFELIDLGEWIIIGRL